jgi:outer membrane protein assembly factor BamB
MRVSFRLHAFASVSSVVLQTRNMLVIALIACFEIARAPLNAAAGDWLQWGGPNRNFTSDTTGLATTWPTGGPRKLWSRPLGEGHSAIVVEAGRLYTMYRPPFVAGRRSQEEVVAAIDGATGKTIWEFKYPAPTSGVDFSEGAGPHATPLIAGNKIFAASSRRELFALDKMTGKLAWSHDFIKEYRAPSPGRGYSCSPLLYNGTIVVAVGGTNQAVMAFNPDTGVPVWKGGSIDYAPASPIVIDVDGQPQLVVFGADRIAGMNPANGQLLWSHPHKTDWGLNISTPLWSGGDHLLFLSSAYGTGSRALELRQSAGKTTVSEKWASSRMRVHISTVIHVGDYVYGSSGDFGTTFLTAINLKTGAVAWQDRAFMRSQLLYADGKLVVLDEDGMLGLATVSPQGIKVLTRARVLDHVAWTPPTLSGKTIFVRDRRTIAAFDLS